LNGPSVVVAPDLGATKLAERYAHILGTPVAIVHKTRLGGDQVSVEHVVGDVSQRIPVIVDDMITTGATIEAAAQAVIARGSVPCVVIAASHALLVGAAVDRLRRLPVKAVAVSDTLAPVVTGRTRRAPQDAHPRGGSPPWIVVSVADLVAQAIDRLSREQSLTDLVVHEPTGRDLH
jgi:ribose-phosphate pyrophosphokinase